MVFKKKKRSALRVQKLGSNAVIKEKYSTWPNMIANNDRRRLHKHIMGMMSLHQPYQGQIIIHQENNLQLNIFALCYGFIIIFHIANLASLFDAVDDTFFSQFTLKRVD